MIADYSDERHQNFAKYRLIDNVGAPLYHRARRIQGLGSSGSSVRLRNSRKPSCGSAALGDTTALANQRTFRAHERSSPT